MASVPLFRRRELGDIKALLIADRAQRRQGVSNGGSQHNDVASRPARILTSSTERSLDRSSDRMRLAPHEASLGEAAPSVRKERDHQGRGDFFVDAMEAPPVLLSARERAVLELVSEGYTNRWVKVKLAFALELRYLYAKRRNFVLRQEMRAFRPRLYHGLLTVGSDIIRRTIDCRKKCWANYRARHAVASFKPIYAHVSVYALLFCSASFSGVVLGR